MMLILGIIGAAASILWFILRLGANAALPAPSIQSVDPWGPLIIGMSISIVLILIHYVGV
jgi:hypothetical protein